MVLSRLWSKSQTTTTVEIYAHFRKCMPAVEGISVGVLNDNNLLKLHTLLTDICSSTSRCAVMRKLNLCVWNSTMTNSYYQQRTNLVYALRKRAMSNVAERTFSIIWDKWWLCCQAARISSVREGPAALCDLTSRDGYQRCVGYIYKGLCEDLHRCCTNMLCRKSGVFSGF